MGKRIIFFGISIICILCWFLYQKGNSCTEREFGVTVTDLVWSFINGKDIIRSHQGRTNVLLLGIGGENHEGGDLTDTMIISSFSSSSSSSAVLVSIPRDLWSDTLMDRINSAYHYGEIQKKGSGLSFSKSILETESGVPIHYAMLLDFSRFREIIDAIGGISVDIPQSFSDDEYPILGKEKDDCEGDPTFRCRYETIAFTKGIEIMDGNRALSYVRSRHSQGDDGNDFSRGRRQQDVLVAVKNKLATRDVVLNPKIVIELFRIFRETVTTDLSLPECIALGTTIMKNFHQSMRQVTLEKKLQDAPVDTYGRFALVPFDSHDDFISFVYESVYQ